MPVGSNTPDSVSCVIVSASTWFAMSACVMLVCTIGMLVSRRLDEVERTAGARPEMEVAS